MEVLVLFMGLVIELHWYEIWGALVTRWDLEGFWGLGWGFTISTGIGLV